MALINLTKDRVNDFLIGLSILISSITFFREPFEGYFHYVIFVGYFPVFINKYGWQPLPFKFILLPTVLSLYNLMVGNCEFFGFFKVFMGMLLSVTFYNYVFIHYNYDFKRLFNIYKKGIIICCYIGLVELVSYRIGFSPGYSFGFILNKWGIHPGSLFGIRVNSIFSEPSQFALMLLPCIFIASHHILLRNFTLLTFRECLLVYLSLILSTSSTGYIGIFFSILLVAINIGKFSDFLILIFVSAFGFYLLYTFVPDFTTRVDASVNLWTKDKYTLDDINSSSFVQYNNIHVAVKNFGAHPLFGTGLGSFPVAYEKYSLTREADFLIKKGFDFNSQDGNSLFFRSMAEMGISGVLFWILLVFRYFTRRSEENPSDITWLYSGALLTIIFGYLLRQGNYFLNGFPFFVLMYVFINMHHKKGKLLLEEEEEEETELKPSPTRP